MKPFRRFASRSPNLRNLQTLTLYRNRLSDPIPPEIGNLANLTHHVSRPERTAGPDPTRNR